MGIEKIAGKAKGAIEVAVQAAKKLKTAKIVPLEVENGTKKIQGSLDALSSTMKAKVLTDSELYKKYGTLDLGKEVAKFNEGISKKASEKTKKIGSDVSEAVKKAVKDAVASDKAAKKFAEEVAAESATKQTMRDLGIIKDYVEKSARNSAEVFIENGRTAAEKALDISELKEKLLTKHAKEFVEKHPELKDPAQLEEFLKQFKK